MYMKYVKHLKRKYGSYIKLAHAFEVDVQGNWS